MAVELARRIGAEIVSLDSMKVYLEMDIGTAKPSAERRRQVPHHLIDIVSPDRHFSTGDYLPLLERTIAEIESRGRRVILCGGTALYLMGFLRGFSALPKAAWEVRSRLVSEARLEGSQALHGRLAAVDPQAAAKLVPGDLRRIVRALEVYETTGRPMSEEWNWESAGPRSSAVLFGLSWERSSLYERTDRRVSGMVDRGLFEEARRLHDRKPPLSRSARQCIGYKEIFDGWHEGSGLEEMIERIQRNTRRFVKRQMTWFRKLPITWLPADGGARPEDLAAEMDRRASTGS